MNYAAVYHMPNGTVLSENDSTSNHSNATTIQASPGTGEIYGGAVYAGAQQDVIPAFTTTAFPYSNTVSFWINLTSSEKTGFADVITDSGAAHGLFILQSGGLNYIYSGNGNSYHESAQNITNGWHYIVETNNGSSGGGTIYIDGAPDSGGTFTGGPFSNLVHAGKDADGGISGSLDEIRFSQVFRPADWITAEYNNNQSAPEFLLHQKGSLQNQGGGGSQVATPTFSPAGGDYSSAQTVTISSTTSGASSYYTTDGSTPTTSSNVYSAPVSVASNLTLKAIAIETGMSNSGIGSATYATNWYNTSWQHRKTITVNSGQVPSTQTDFPMLVSLQDSDLEGARTDGHDIVFTDSDGISVLPYELEAFTKSTGTLVAWVKVHSLSNGKVIYMYFDNSSATDQSQPAATWISSYAAVWHLASASATDSTANGNSATANTATQTASGKIDGANSYDGTQLTTVPTVSNNYFNGQYSWAQSFWVNFTGVSSDNYGAIIANNGSEGIFIIQDGGNYYLDLYGYGGDHLSTGILSPSTWYQVVLVDTNNSLKIYINGNLDSTHSMAGPERITYFGGDTTEHLTGIVDEVRAINGNNLSFLAADWITTEHNNQSAPSSFYTPGPLE